MLCVFFLALLFLCRLSPTLTTAVNNQCHHNSMLITFSSLSRIASYMRFHQHEQYDTEEDVDENERVDNVKDRI